MEQCEKNRLIRKERSDEITAALSGVILLGEQHWEDHVRMNMMWNNLRAQLLAQNPGGLWREPTRAARMGGGLPPRSDRLFG